MIYLTQIIVILVLCTHVMAVRRGIKTSIASPRGSAVVTTFGLAQRGTVAIDYSITLNGRTTTADDMEKYNFYFIAAVVNEEQRAAYFGDFLETQVFDILDVETICNAPTIARWQIYGIGNITHTLTGRDSRAERTSAIMLQCREGLAATESSYPVMDVEFDVTMVNARPEGTGVSHLGVEDVMMVRTLEGECIIYCLMLAGLLGQIWYHRGNNLRLQFLFLGCLCFQIVTIFVRYSRWNKLNEDGLYSIEYFVAVRMLESVTEVANLCTILLIALGWSTVHFQLTEIQIQVTMAGMGFFLIMSLSWAGCTQANSRACQSLYLVYYILHSLVMLGIIICLNFTITQLRAMLAHTQWDPSTPYCYARTKQFQTFRIAFVLYLLLPTAILLVQDILYTWEQDWLGTVLPDILQICLYLNVGSTFAPLKDHFMNRAFSQQFVVPVDGNAWQG